MSDPVQETTPNENTPAIDFAMLPSPDVQLKAMGQPRPRSNSTPGSNHHSSSYSLKEGMKVIIIGTENVFQRVPQLVGKIGTIKEAPVHPATWFKVEFPDHRIVTFRPSALRPVGEDGKPLPSFGNIHHSASSHHHHHGSASPGGSGIAFGSRKGVGSLLPPRNAGSNAHSPASGNHLGGTAAGASRKPSAASVAANAGSGQWGNGVLLSTTDPDSWIGQKVQVATGRHLGHIGTVLSSGNGWVQIDTSVGEVAKRSYELTLVGPAGQGAANIGHYGGGGIANRADNMSDDGSSEYYNEGHDRSRRQLRPNPNRFTNVGNLYDPRVAFNALEQSVFGGALGGFYRRGGLSVDTTSTEDGTDYSRLYSHKRPRSYSDSLMSLSPSFLGLGGSGGGGSFRFFGNGGTTDQDGNSSSNNSSSSSGGNRPANFLSTLPNDESLLTTSYLQSGTYLLNSQQAQQPSQPKKKDPPPLKSQSIIDARKHYITKYVNRHLQKISDRPNLVDWKQQLDATMVTNALFERQSAVQFEESHCDVCNTEKWPGAKFCWNEGCPISPVYYKTTGQSKQDIVAAGLQGTAVSVPATPGAGTPRVLHGDDDEGNSLFGASAGPLKKRPRLELGASAWWREDEAQTQQADPNVSHHNATEYFLSLPTRVLGSVHPARNHSSPFSSSQCLLNESELLSLRESDGIAGQSQRRHSSLGSTTVDSQYSAGSAQFPSLLRADGSGVPLDMALQQPADTATVAEPHAATTTTGAAAGQGRTGYYTQYFHKQDRSDSFAGGETDSEVADNEPLPAV